MSGRAYVCPGVCHLGTKVSIVMVGKKLVRPVSHPESVAILAQAAVLKLEHICC